MAKPGRTPGTQNSPDPVRDAIKQAVPQQIMRRRAPQESFQGTKNISNLKMDAVSHACLSLHARRRGVPMAWLIQDVLNCWLNAATDYDQALFREILPRNARAQRTPERYAGYLDSLGFAAPAPQAPAIEIPELRAYMEQPSGLSPQASAELRALNLRNEIAFPPARTEPTIADMARPYVHPLAVEGKPSYPHPSPGLPQGSQPFDPARHAQVAGQYGHGSAAQEASNGQSPQDELPNLPEQVEAWRKHYQVDPKDIR